MRSLHFETGYVAFAHGLQGEVGVKTFDPDSEALLEVDRVLLHLKDGSDKVMEITSARPTPKAILLQFEGVASRQQAEALVGSKVAVFREDLSEPEAGEYFFGDLVGLVAKDSAGQELGKVEEVWETGPVPNLVIRRGEFELIVPFAAEFVPAVDLENGVITILPPEYLE